MCGRSCCTSQAQRRTEAAQFALATAAVTDSKRECERPSDFRARALRARRRRGRSHSRLGAVGDLERCSWAAYSAAHCWSEQSDIAFESNDLARESASGLDVFSGCGPRVIGVERGGRPHALKVVPDGWPTSQRDQAAPTRRARCRYCRESRTNSTRPSPRANASRSMNERACQMARSPICCQRRNSARNRAARNVKQSFPYRWSSFGAPAPRCRRRRCRSGKYHWSSS